MLATYTSWEHRRIASGLCLKCAEPIAAGKKRFCEKHVIWNRKRSNERYYRNAAKAKKTNMLTYVKRRVELMVLLEGALKCRNCPEIDYRVLSFDHINGRSKSEGRTLTAEEIKDIRAKNAPNLRVLCCNCQVRNEFARGNRTLSAEQRSIVIAAGGFIPETDSP